MARTDEHHDNRYEDGEPVQTGIAALDYPDWVACPEDGGEGRLLGTIYRFTHYQCRECHTCFATYA